MNKNILTIALLFLMLFMISCSAENDDTELDVHTNTINRVSATANINQASNYIFSDEPDTPAEIDTPQILQDKDINITETELKDSNTDSLPTKPVSENETEIIFDDKFNTMYTSIYNKIPPLETKIFKKEAQQAEEAKKEKEKELKKKPAQKKPGKLIGSFKTVFNAANKPRVSNIKRAASKLNGAVIKPGRVFSFNRYIGPTGESDGYKPATVIVKGKETKGFGGGVCQVSSTLFNVCDKAGLEILERHSHSKKVPYLPEGRDAAVSYGGIDFKFRNSHDYSVRIKANVSKGAIVVSLEKVQV